MAESNFGSVYFNTLIKHYINVQSQVLQAIQQVSKNISTATPGQFLLLQFQMAQVTQI